MKTNNLTILADMYGCPNRCKHCWLGHMPNKKMPDDSDELIVNYFKPYFHFTVGYVSLIIAKTMSSVGSEIYKYLSTQSRSVLNL